MEPSRARRLGLLVLVVALVVAWVGMLLLSDPGRREEEFSSTDSGTVLEEQGKLNAAATATVQSLADRFGDDLRIVALERHGVDDYDLIGELFPEYPKGTIGCIIVAYAGSEGAVFVEDPKLRIIHEEPLSTFVARTRDVDPALVAAFYLSLA